MVWGFRWRTSAIRRALDRQEEREEELRQHRLAAEARLRPVRAVSGPSNYRRQQDAYRAAMTRARLGPEGVRALEQANALAALYRFQRDAAARAFRAFDARTVESSRDRALRAAQAELAGGRLGFIDRAVGVVPRVPVVNPIWVAHAPALTTARALGVRLPPIAQPTLTLREAPRAAFTSVVPQPTLRAVGDIPYIGEHTRRFAEGLTSPAGIASLGLGGAAIGATRTAAGFAGSYVGGGLGRLAETRLGVRPLRTPLGAVGPRAVGEIAGGFWEGGGLRQLAQRRAGAFAREVAANAPETLAASGRAGLDVFEAAPRAPVAEGMQVSLPRASSVSVRAAPAPAPPAPATSVPRAALEYLLGRAEPETGLGTLDRMLNVAKRAVGAGASLEHPVATGIMRLRDRLRSRMVSRSNRVTESLTAAVRKNFDRDKYGRIKDLPGMPTVQDVAARLPLYADQLTPGQMAALMRIKDELEPYRAALLEQGVELRSRPDVMEGGFYIPRGPAEAVGQPEVKYRGSGRAGKRGFEKHAEFDSMTEGINAGYEYGSLEEALAAYTRDAADRATSAYIANIFKSLRDEAGNLVGETPSMRMERLAPGLAERVRQLRQRIRGRMQTLSRQVIRERMTEAEAARTRRQAEAAASRTARAQAYAAVREAEFVPEDLVSARTNLAEVVRETQRTAREVGQNIAQLRGARQALSRRERELGRLADQATAEAQRAQAIVDGQPKASPSATYREYRRALAAQRKLERQIDRLTPGAEALAARVDGLIERGAILRDLDQAARQSLTEARRVERALLKQERDLALARRELRLLGAEERRALQSARGARQRLVAARARAVQTDVTIDDLQAQLAAIEDDYRRTVERARQTPRGQSTIPLTELSGWTFPDELANVAKRFLEREGPIRGSGATAVQVVNALNNLVRPLRATLDVSGAGIQLILGAVVHPPSYAQALSVYLRALADPDVMARFTDDFNRRALAAGRPTADDWIKAGLRYGGSDTEIAIGRQSGLGRLGETIGNLPGIKQTNRGFGASGDYLRLSLADALWEPGKSLDEIAETVNNMTGWSERRFGGDIGGLVLFAPRYFQSQLELVAKAAAAGGTRGAEARRALLKLMGAGAILTVAANEALGGFDDPKEYLAPFRTSDGELTWNPLAGNYNPNFMRIRIPGTLSAAGARLWESQDVSLFGPWDSLLKAAVAAAHGEPHYVLRTKGSSAVSIATALGSGQTFTGENPYDIETFVRTQIAPFTLSELGQEPLGATAIGGLGIKAAPTTEWELRRNVLNDVSQELYGEPFSDLNSAQRWKVRQDPRVVEATERAEGSATGDLAASIARQDEREASIAAFKATGRIGNSQYMPEGIAEYDRAFRAGEIDLDTWLQYDRQYRDGLRALQAALRAGDEPYAGAQSENPVDEAIAKYFTISPYDYYNRDTKVVDWDGFFTARERAKAAAVRLGGQDVADYIDRADERPLKQEQEQAYRLFDRAPEKYAGAREGESERIDAFLEEVQQIAREGVRQADGSYARVPGKYIAEYLAEQRRTPELAEWYRKIQSGYEEHLSPAYNSYLRRHYGVLSRWMPWLYDSLSERERLGLADVETFEFGPPPRPARPRRPTAREAAEAAWARGVLEGSGLR